AEARAAEVAAEAGAGAAVADPNISACGDHGEHSATAALHARVSSAWQRHRFTAWPLDGL
ncbi:MAG TPA: hypothetical protein VGN92_15080, partial [Mycobacterium sp.]|nr:hypothetical protein [Mycobacterium sp.]